MRTINNANPSRFRSRVGTAGFTIIEVGAVLFIIGILVALLSASLNRAKGRALRISCLDNLKELQLAWHMYVDDNADLLPLNKTALGGGNYKVFGRRASTNSWVAGNPKEDTTTANIEIGTLFPYISTPRLYRCPMDRSRVVAHRDIPRTRSYSMNSFLAGDNEDKDSRVKMRMSSLDRPNRIFVFIEEHESSAWVNGFQVAPKDSGGLGGATWTSTPSDRHEQGCNLSFADGHIEYWKWYAGKSDNLENHLTSTTRELYDLRRLQSAIPSK
jgi:prepilin-type processing-associated H-X9-DG protein